MSEQSETTASTFDVTHTKRRRTKYSKLSNCICCIIDITYMGGLIVREKELRKLNYIFNDPKLRSCAVIGRRRIGKTTLIKEFIEDRDVNAAKNILARASLPLQGQRGGPATIPDT